MEKLVVIATLTWLVCFAIAGFLLNTAIGFFIVGAECLALAMAGREMVTKEEKNERRTRAFGIKDKDRFSEN